MINGTQTVTKGEFLNTPHLYPHCAKKCAETINSDRSHGLERCLKRHQNNSPESIENISILGLSNAARNCMTDDAKGYSTTDRGTDWLDSDEGLGEQEGQPPKTDTGGSETSRSSSRSFSDLCRALIWYVLLLGHRTAARISCEQFRSLPQSFCASAHLSHSFNAVFVPCEECGTCWWTRHPRLRRMAKASVMIFGLVANLIIGMYARDHGLELRAGNAVKREWKSNPEYTVCIMCSLFAQVLTDAQDPGTLPNDSPTDWMYHPPALIFFISTTILTWLLAWYYEVNGSHLYQKQILLVSFAAWPVLAIVLNTGTFGSVLLILPWTVYSSLVLSEIVHFVVGNGTNVLVFISISTKDGVNTSLKPEVPHKNVEQANSCPTNADGNSCTMKREYDFFIPSPGRSNPVQLTLGSISTMETLKPT